MNNIQYFKNLPEGTTLEFVDEHLSPVKVRILEGDKFQREGKVVSVMLCKEYEPDGRYDIKLLSGIQFLALHWQEYRENYFRFACTESDDARWKNESFRQHMYVQYVDTDRPVTDQLYNLDDKNLNTLFRYIKEDLMRYNADLVRAF